MESRDVWDPDGDGDDDSTPEGDTDNSHWDADGQPIMAQWLADGASPPGSVPADDDDDMVSSGVSTAIGYGPDLVGGSMTSANHKEMAVRAQMGMEWREVADNPMGQLYGIFSEFNSWYPVSSAWEGDFVERVAPGAFADTIKNDKASMRVLYDHGQDPSIGNKPLGRITALREEANGPYYEVDLFATDYNANQIVPLLRGALMNGQTTGSALGSSFRFQVQDDSWNMKPKVSKFNPDGLPQRTILKAKVFEFGPVTFPANAGATASARSMTDQWLAKLLSQRDEEIPAVLRRLREAVTPDVIEAAARDARRSHQDRLRRQARALLTLAG